MALRLYNRDTLAGTIENVQAPRNFEMTGQATLTPAGDKLRLEMDALASADGHHDCFVRWTIVDENGVSKRILLQMLESDGWIEWRE